MLCELQYIPEHLKRNGRAVIEDFYIGEYLYYRCKEENRLNPFDSISLRDISVNRSGNLDNGFSYPEDVLYNTNPSEKHPEEKFDLSVTCLAIVELIENRYNKQLRQPESTLEVPNPPNQLIANIYLKHKPIECNYSHSAFEIYFNEIEVTSANYEETIGRKNSETRKLRTMCKHELTIMIINEVVKINW